MNSNFVLSLKRVGYETSKFPNALDVLENNYNELITTLRKHQIKKPKTIKEFVINTFNEILHEEKWIREHTETINRHFWSLKETRSIDKLSPEREYYVGICRIIDDTKAHLLQFLCAYYPDAFIKSEELYNLMTKYVPRYDIYHQKIESKRTKIKLATHQSHEQVGTYSECATALHLKNITINTKGIGVSDGINYKELFGLKSGKKLYNTLNELGSFEKFREKANQIIKEKKL